jgi:hypothetical protein
MRALLALAFLTGPALADELATPQSFSHIADRDERAAAMFTEATRVMLHPRCSNCHPQGDTPLQTDEQVVHNPPVFRGDHDEGVPGLLCSSCHQDHNLELARVPGAPKWHLAPKVMAWVGRTPIELCEQIKDPQRNGNKTLAQIVDHVAHDKLVAWGWDPGHGREPAPGTQKSFGVLVQAWVDAGAGCPKPPAPKEKK